eukprot:gene2416-2880_t
MSSLQGPDYVIVILYFVVLLFAGLYRSVSKFLNTNNEETSVKEYFLADKSMYWIAVGASLFCSNIGSEHLIGLAGTGAKSGLPVAWFEWSGPFTIIALGYIFMPLYLKSNIYTVPQFLELRYGKNLRFAFAIFSIFSFIFTRISVTIFTGSIVFESILGWNMWTSVGVILGTSALYSVIGGLQAVIITDLLQSVVLVFGSVILLIISIYEAGGISTIYSKSPEKFHLWRPITDPDFPWLGSILDQVIIQTVLSAKNLGNAQSGTLQAGYLKLLSPFTMVIPGIIAHQLFPEEIAQNSDSAYPLLIVRLMPVVFKGLMITAMLSAAMSSLANVFNSSATIFTMDIWTKFRPKAKDGELLWVGRIATLTIAILSVAWIPGMKLLSDQVLIALAKVGSYTRPPIAAIFFGGIFFKYTTSIGAWSGLICGLFLGFCRFILEMIFISKTDNYFLLDYFIRFNYLLFGSCLFLFTLFVMLIGTILTPKSLRPNLKDVEKYCFNYSEIWSYVSCKSLRMKFKGEINNSEERNLTENEMDHPIDVEMKDESEINGYMYVSIIHKYARFLIIPLFISVISIMIIFG